MNLRGLKHPLELQRLLWPDVTFYAKQKEIIDSVRYNDETFVPAGNMLGKDFVGGFIALGAFLCPNLFLRAPGEGSTGQEVRVITTSVKDDHLRVLWGEIGRYVQTSKFPLTRDKGGPLVVNHRDVRKSTRLTKDGRPDWVEDKISYLRGMVSERGEGLAGHHAANTLLIVDEGSGVDDQVYQAGQGWMKRLLVIGNPLPCANFFFRACEAGDLPY